MPLALKGQVLGYMQSCNKLMTLLRTDAEPLAMTKIDNDSN